MRYQATNTCGTGYGTAITATVKPNPTVTISGVPGSTQCAGTEVTLTGNSNISGTTYSWSGGSTSGSNVVTGTDHTYNVTCTGTANGCTGTASAQVSFHPAIDRSSITAGDVAICGGAGSDPITISGSAASGVGTLTYQWLRNGSEVASGSDATSYTISSNEIAGLSEGVYTYKRMVKDDCNDYGQSSNEFILRIAPPTAPTADDAAICAGQSATLTATGPAGYN